MGQSAGKDRRFGWTIEHHARVIARAEPCLLLDGKGWPAAEVLQRRASEVSDSVDLLHHSGIGCSYVCIYDSAGSIRRDDEYWDAAGVHHRVRGCTGIAQETA